MLRLDLASRLASFQSRDLAIHKRAVIFSVAQPCVWGPMFRFGVCSVRSRNEISKGNGKGENTLFDAVIHSFILTNGDI